MKAIIVPMPIPIISSDAISEIMIFKNILKTPNMFFTDPVSFFEKSASDCTIPSPGLGMRSMSSVAAAPIPVDITARDRSLSVIDED